MALIRTSQTAEWNGYVDNDEAALMAAKKLAGAHVSEPRHHNAARCAEIAAYQGGMIFVYINTAHNLCPYIYFTF